MLRANYHTHTWRCHHAGEYPDQAYVEAAVQNRFEILGFSDHIPWPYRSGYIDTRSRMTMAQLPEYVRSVRQLEEDYRDRLKIFCAMECEYYPEYMDHLRMVHDTMDYLILGMHYLSSNENPDAVVVMKETTPEHFDDYADRFEEALNTGMFVYAAHPDLIFNQYPRFDADAEKVSRRICEAAKAVGLPLEYNLYGVYKQRQFGKNGLGYPCEDFWRVAAEAGCTAIIGCDAHMPSMLLDDGLHDYAKTLLNQLRIPVLETLPGLE